MSLNGPELGAIPYNKNLLRSQSQGASRFTEVEQVPTWELLAAGAVALLVVFLFRPGIRAAFEQSKNAPKDWAGVLLPLGIVVLFVILLIAIV